MINVSFSSPHCHQQAVFADSEILVRRRDHLLHTRLMKGLFMIFFLSIPHAPQSVHHTNTYYGCVAWSAVLQEFYCCQSVTNLSEITCASKVKTVFKTWPLVVFCNSVCVCMYMHRCIQGFLNTCPVFQPAWGHITELIPVTTNAWEWAKSWGKSEFSHLPGMVHWRNPLCGFLVPLLTCHCGNT